MPKPQMYIPRRWMNTGFGRRYYAEGWQDGLAGQGHRYSDVQATLDLVRLEGQAALLAYEDGFAAGLDAAEQTQDE